MIAQKLQGLDAGEARERLKLTDNEYKLLQYLKGNKRSKDINAVCVELAMSKQSLIKTHRSLAHKLERM